MAARTKLQSSKSQKKSDWSIRTWRTEGFFHSCSSRSVATSGIFQPHQHWRLAAKSEGAGNHSTCWGKYFSHTLGRQQWQATVTTVCKGRHPNVNADSFLSGPPTTLKVSSAFLKGCYCQRVFLKETVLSGIDPDNWSVLPHWLEFQKKPTCEEKYRQVEMSC